MVSTVRLGVVKQGFFSLPAQYGRRLTRANCLNCKPITGFPQERGLVTQGKYYIHAGKSENLVMRKKNNFGGILVNEEI